MLRIADHDGIRNRPVLAPASKELTTSLRRATPDDIPSIIALEREVPTLVHWSEQTYQAVFQPGAPDRSLLVIDDDGAVRAFLIARFSVNECELENLVVAAAYRRRGLGKQLLNSLIATARQRNVERILLEVRESNTAARALYEKIGYQLNGRRRAYYNHPQEDALMFALNCTSSSASNR
jgi:[ribosomal protein S18]-alanine N-acetyltransferase